MRFGSPEHLAAMRGLSRSAGDLHSFTLLWSDGSTSFKEYRGTKAQAFARLRQALPRMAVRHGRADAVLYNGNRVTSDELALLRKIRT